MGAAGGAILPRATVAAVGARRHVVEGTLAINIQMQTPVGGSLMGSGGIPSVDVAVDGIWQLHRRRRDRDAAGHSDRDLAGRAITPQGVQRPATIILHPQIARVGLHRIEYLSNGAAVAGRSASRVVFDGVTVLVCCVMRDTTITVAQGGAVRPLRRTERGTVVLLHAR